MEEQRIHEQYMERAIELAKKGMGHTSPNPMVGCVVVKAGKIISEGYHEQYGGFHAERNALLACREDVQGADLYVTLEPCCHYGKTPPCTEIILEKRLGRVFVGSMDANPLVAGKGVQLLREHGIEVVTGVLKEKCDRLNEIFFHYIRTGMPFTALKYAMTLDGKIACEGGDSKWVTSEEARRHVHQLRKQYSAILVGIQTVLTDDPMLNCRLEEGVDPVRIVCDSKLRIPTGSRLVKTAKQIPTYIAFCDTKKADPEKRKYLEQAGCHLLELEKEQSVTEAVKGGVLVQEPVHLSMKQLLKKLGELKLDSVLVEGGGTINAAFVREQLADRVYAYIAPKLVGGKNARTPVEGTGIEKMCEALELEELETQFFGKDLLISGRVKK